MERKQKSFDGQDSDGGQKDSLESLNPSQKDPYRAKASEFSVKKVTPANGQGADGPGQDQLVPWGGNLTSPRNAEGMGGASDSMSDRKGLVASNFKVSTNAGESGVAPTSVGNDYGVNLSTGAIECSSYKQTVVKEVKEDAVSIG